jgi:putative membrane protein
MWIYGYGWGMRDWEKGSELILWLVILGAIITGVVFLFVRSQWLGGNQRGSSLEVLEERYARGEITREQYLQKKRDILA